MNITAQHIAPEEIMVFLDGELSVVKVQAISAHVDDCHECAKVVEQMRRTSQALSAWKVREIPAKAEMTVSESVTKAQSGLRVRKPGFFIRTSFWSWKQYAALSSGALSVLLIVAAIGLPNLQHSRSRAQMADSYYTPLPEDKTRYSRAKTIKPLGEGRVAGAAIGKLQGNDRDALRSSSAPQNVVSAQLVESEPMIAHAVSLSIMTREFAASRSTLDAILARYHGYSADLNVSTVENAPRNLQASLRIPAPALASAVGELKKLGRVENEAQSGEEVTRQHADLVARLKNSRDTEERLRSILDQRTGKIGEVLQVEREIARVRGEIESMEAEQKALEHRVDFATVELQLTEEYKAELNPPTASVSGRIRNAFIAGYHNASDALLGIFLFFVEFAPALLVWLAVLAAPVAMLWRRYRRIRASV